MKSSFLVDPKKISWTWFWLIVMSYVIFVNLKIIANHNENIIFNIVADGLQTVGSIMIIVLVGSLYMYLKDTLQQAKDNLMV